MKFAVLLLVAAVYAAEDKPMMGGFSDGVLDDDTAQLFRSW